MAHVGFAGIKKQGVYAYISASAATSCTANDWIRLAGTFTNEVLENFVIAGTPPSVTYRGSETHFKVDVFGTFESTINSTVLDVGLFVNGVLQVNSVMTQELNSNNDVYTIALTDVLSLGFEDYIEIKIRADRDASVIANTLTTSLMCFWGCSH